MASRLSGGWAALQQRLSQPVETITRTVQFGHSNTGVDELDPPSDLDEFWTQYKQTGIVRSNLNQFVSDVVAPGVRVDADSETTVDYFMGGDAAPADTPEGGFLSQCFVFAGERHQPFLPGLKSTILNRWVRGTNLTELLKSDPEDAESPITGFYQFRPEITYPRVYQNKNILLHPDPDYPGNEGIEVELTPREEVAAYSVFDDQSIIGRRIGGFDKDRIYLSQNDVLKQVLDPDIGGDDADEQGVFGESVMAAISTDVTEYNATKRDRYKAVQRKAYGIWLAQFSKEVLEIDETQNEVVEWSEESQNDFSETLDDLGPGDVLEADGPVELKEFQSDVPELESTLDHYVDDITAPLPAPKYSVGFEQNINQFVTERQETRYDRFIDEERRYQERKWGWAFRMVAERHPNLDPSGLLVLLEPEQDDSPVLSLTLEETEKMLNIARAYDAFAGPTASPGTLVDDETLLTELMQLPEDVAPAEEAEIPEDAEAMFEQLDSDLEGGDA